MRTMVNGGLRLDIVKDVAYPAVFNPAPEGGYDVMFPDFPGCVTFGRTLEEAQANAVEVLELWLEELTERHQAIPARLGRPIIDEVKVGMARL